MENLPTTRALLERFVAYHTVNGNELPLAQEIARLAEAIGMRVQVDDLGNDRANVYAEAGEGPCLLLCGHLDVVPAEGAWQSDPFTLRDAGERCVGRGCADMKGAVAAMITAAGQAMARGLTGMKLALLFVADEESGNRGMKRFLAEHPNCADACVVGEPTEMEVAVAHKGVARFWVELQGRAAHASTPALGENALTRAARAVLALEAYNQKLALETHPILPPKTICVTLAQGGERENIVPAHAELMVDHRIYPGETEQTAETALHAALEPLREADPGFAYSLRQHCYLPGGSLPMDHPWTRAVCRIAGETLARTCKPVEFRASCEQALMLNAGVPTVILGPGSLDEAHTVEESLPWLELEQAVAVYGRLIERFVAEYKV
ncbi:MAG: M20/M25/M40 family metallo-hydrolase [Eubacteriales bacterium]|nr:M20/M25/M40 family metallo-hydrolase [Eubacteriales bacterium]